MLVPRRTSLAAVALGAAVAVAAPAALAHPDSLYDRKHQLDGRIASLRTQIDQAEEREGVLSSEIEAADSDIESLEGDIGELSDRLAALESELVRHRTRLARLEERYREQTRDLDRLVRDHTVAVRRLEGRLVELYEADAPDTLAILLQAQSLSDLVDRIDSMNEIGLQDRRIAAELRRLALATRAARERTAATKAEVTRATAALVKKAAEAGEARAALIARRSALSAARAEKTSLLASVRTERREAEEDLGAMEAASAALTARIQQTQAAASASTGATPSASGFIWPVSGPVTSGFGMRWGRLHAGIDIGAATGTAVHAAASGTVILAGWMGGYGNLVVVDHGGGVATAYAHLSAIWAGGGSVVQGQAIGAVGCTGHCFGSHLHFEVRVNGSPVDPLGYL